MAGAMIRSRVRALYVVSSERSGHDVCRAQVATVQVSPNNFVERESHSGSGSGTSDEGLVKTKNYKPNAGWR